MLEVRTVCTWEAEAAAAEGAAADAAARAVVGTGRPAPSVSSCASVSTNNPRTRLNSGTRSLNT
eukprot:676201-Pyramimonas_sp.AAC.1